MKELTITYSLRYRIRDGLTATLTVSGRQLQDVICEGEKALHYAVNQTAAARKEKPIGQTTAD